MNDGLRATHSGLLIGFFPLGRGWHIDRWWLWQRFSARQLRSFGLLNSSYSLQAPFSSLSHFHLQRELPSSLRRIKQLLLRPTTTLKQTLVGSLKSRDDLSALLVLLLGERKRLSLCSRLSPLIIKLLHPCPSLGDLTSRGNQSILP